MHVVSSCARHYAFVGSNPMTDRTQPAPRRPTHPADPTWAQPGEAIDLLTKRNDVPSATGKFGQKDIDDRPTRPLGRVGREAGRRRGTEGFCGFDDSRRAQAGED